MGCKEAIMIDFILNKLFEKTENKVKSITILNRNREINFCNKKNILINKEKNISDYFVNIKSLIKTPCVSLPKNREFPQFSGRNFQRESCLRRFHI